MDVREANTCALEQIAFLENAADPAATLRAAPLVACDILAIELTKTGNDARLKPGKEMLDR